MENWYIRPNQISEDGYLGFEAYDHSPITVMQWDGESSYPCHRHHYYELVLMKKGVSVHEYRGVKIPLLPGDIFLIEPDEWHGYEIGSMSSFINCKIFPALLVQEQSRLKGRTVNKPVHANDGIRFADFTGLLETAAGMKGTSSDEVRGNYLEELNLQGVLHLSADEFRQVESLLLRMEAEQGTKDEYSGTMKFALLQEILVLLCRIGTEKRAVISRNPDSKKEMIFCALAYIDEHLEQDISFEQFASENYVSLGYYRSLFKEITGMSPVEYLNRRRVIRSLELLRNDRYSIALIAEKVGLRDANYYSRVFRKVMGYPPRDYRMNYIRTFRAAGTMGQERPAAAEFHANKME